MMMVVVVVTMIMIMMIMVMVMVITGGLGSATELGELEIREVELRRKGFEANFGREEGSVVNRFRRVDSETSCVTRERVEFGGADWKWKGFHW